MKKKKILLGILVTTFAIGLTACGSKTESKHEYTVGVVSDADNLIWEEVAKNLKDEGITLKTEEFSDYNTPNDALEDGSIDLNAFQHVAFMDNFNKEKDGNLVSIGYTYVSPLGLYSKKIKNYKDLKDGDTVAIPNDVTNEGRAIQLLAAIDVLTLKDTKVESPSLKDIASYKKKIKIKELDAAQIPTVLEDVDAGIINTNYAVDSGLSPKEDALYVDTDNLSKVGDIYKNVIAVTSKNKDKEDFKKIVKAYQTKKVAELISKTSDGNNVPAW